MLINKLLSKSNSDKFAIWRIIYLLVGGVMAASVIITSYFVYQNIYSTLSNTEAIGFLQANTNVDTLNLKDYDKIRILMEKKEKAQEIPANIKNIFLPYSPTSTTSTVTNAPTSTKK